MSHKIKSKAQTTVPMSKGIVVLFLLFLTLNLNSCSKNNDEDPSATSEILVKVGTTKLTNNDLKKNLPSGLSTEDSTRYARAYIKTWINNQLLRQIAAKEIDMTEIDKMVEQYRDELITLEYRRQMYESHNNDMIPEDTIRSFYDNHSAEFVLNRPMVKGVYIKVANDAQELPTLRKLYKSHNDKDIDNLDKTANSTAVHYDYFRDKWIDWEQIETHLPYDFGSNPDTFLKNNHSLEYSYGGFTYLLDITGVLHTGQAMPYEAARNQIIDRLKFSNRRNYDEQLRRNLYENGLEEGKISIFCDLGD